MKNFFAVPDKEKNYKSYMVYIFTIIWTTVTLAVIPLGFYFFPLLWTRWLTLLCASLIISFFHLCLNSYGYTRLASFSFTIIIWLFATTTCYSAGGVFAPGILSQMCVILIAGFLLDWRGGLTIGLLTIGADFWMAYIESIGQLPSPSVIHTPITRWIASIIPFGTIIALQHYATLHMHSSLVTLKREILKRKDAEKTKDQMVHNLGERVKELKTLYNVSRILHKEHTPIEELFNEIVKIIPLGWQYPDITAARLCIADKQYLTNNYSPTEYCQRGETKTANDTNIHMEIVYLQAVPEADEGPFLKEERNLINMLVEMLKIDLERRERQKELKDYKYALDIASIVSIAEVDGSFSFVNENFCKTSKYTSEELIGKQHDILWSGYHSPEYFTDLHIAMQDGKPFKGEFCNKAKDGTLYWADTTIVPFLDEHGKIYQYLSIIQDVTKRKEADLNLKQSEERNRTMIENMSDGLLLLNSNGEVFYQSPSVQRITGYTLEERKSHSIYELIHPEDLPILNDVAKKALDNPNVPINYQIRIIHKSGKQIWANGNIVNLLNNESVGAIMINYSDITDRKNATELFNYQFYNSPDSILIVNKDLIIENLNRITLGVFEREKAIGQNAIQILPPENREIAKIALIKCFDTGENQEFENTLTLGRFVRSRMVPIILDGTINRVMIFLTDITKQKLIEQELKRSEIKNRALIENLSEAIALIDENEKIIYQSPSVTQITGYLPEDRYGDKIFSIVHREEIADFKMFLKKVYNSPGVPQENQFRVTHKSGEIIWLEGTFVNMLENESIKGVILNYRDITERKKAEEEIRESKERYKSIISVSNIGAWEYHHDTGVVWYSSEYFSMLGISRPDGAWDDSMATTWKERLHPEDRERSINDFNDFLNGGSEGLYESYFRMRHEDGHWVWIWSRGRRLLDKNGNLTSITLGSHIDITERIESEEKIRKNEELLRKITSQVPGNTYMFEIDKNGKSQIIFSNQGTDAFNDSNNYKMPNKKHQKLDEILYLEDKDKFDHAMKQAYLTHQPISLQYRVFLNNQIRWYWIQAVAEKDEAGKFLWYGATSDITPLVDYLASVEQIIFDISHVIRRPISSMLGITGLIMDDELKEEEIKEYASKLFLISKEMDNFVHELNLVYNQKRQNTKLNIDIPSLIDRRNSLFN